MKFTKEDAIKDLEAKFKDKKSKYKDLDLTRTIKEVVENTLDLIGDNEELELSDFIAKVEKSIASAAGLSLHETKKAVADKDKEIKSLKDKLNGSSDSDDDDDDDDTDDDDDNADTKGKKSKYVKDLEKRLKALEEKDAADKKSKKIADVRKDLFDKIKELGVDDEDWINDTLADVTITEDMDVDDKADHFVKRYNKYCSNHDADVTPRRGGGHEGEKTNPVLDDVKASIKRNREAKGLAVNK